MERGRQMFNVKCPECGGKLVCHCVYGSDETSSGLTERMYCCVECLTTWTTQGDGEDETELQRYFSDEYLQREEYLWGYSAGMICSLWADINM